MLTPAQQQARRGKLTASRIGVIMTGDAAALYRLWQEMTEDPNFQPEDLSGNWAVQLGTCTEPLNLDWYERRTGHLVTRRGEVVVHPTLSWAAATLDGWDVMDQHPVEAKHVNGFTDLSLILSRYLPQVYWQMLVTGATKACLSVILGARAPVLEIISLDLSYAHDLMDRARTFWTCVETLTPPVALPVVSPPSSTRQRIVVDMTGNTIWADSAVRWRDNRAAAKVFESASQDLKALMTSSDVKMAYGHGITVHRTKNGALSIREEKKDVV